MAQRVDDLWPSASGAASLGADQLSGPQAGFAREIRPFNHIHMNSGVIHDVLYGGSGVIRYSMGPSIDPGLGLIAPGGKQNAIEISEDGGQSFKLRLGGTPATFNTPNGYALIDTGHDAALYIRGSGIDVISGTSINVRTLPPVSAGVPAAIEMSSWDGINLTASAGDLFTIVIDGDTSLSNEGGQIRLNSNGNTNSIGGQIALDAFGGSGRMQFRFGPYQAWHVKLTHSSSNGPAGDGFWPLPHSGQIAQMIVQGVSLQSAYEVNNNIFTSATQGGSVNIVGTNVPTLGLYAAEAGPPHVLISGVIDQITTGNDTGAFYLQRHTLGRASDLIRLGISSITTKAQASALSLGPDTLFLNTGSGVANISIASGICSFVNLGTSSSITEAGLNVNIAVGGQLIADTFYNPVANSGIKINVPGCYRVQYSVFAEKNNGNLQQTMRSRAIVNDQWGRTFTIIGGESYASLRDSNAHNKATANGVCMVDVSANDVININVNTTEAPPADNSIRIPARGCSVVLEYIGPQKGFSTKLAA